MSGQTKLNDLTPLERIERLEAIVEQLIEKSSKKKFTKPTFDEVRTYMVERELAGTPAFLDMEANKFINHYTSNGWKVGKNLMKDWKAAVRNWVSNVKEGIYNGKNITGNFSKKPLRGNDNDDQRYVGHV